MMRHRRLPMKLALARQPLDAGVTCRNPDVRDKEDLAILLYAAYRGTIDDEGETFADAVAEVDKLFAGPTGNSFRTAPSWPRRAIPSRRRV